MCSLARYLGPSTVTGARRRRSEGAREDSHLKGFGLGSPGHRTLSPPGRSVLLLLPGIAPSIVVRGRPPRSRPPCRLRTAATIRAFVLRMGWPPGFAHSPDPTDSVLWTESGEPCEFSDPATRTHGAVRRSACRAPHGSAIGYGPARHDRCASSSPTRPPTSICSRPTPLSLGTHTTVDPGSSLNMVSSIDGSSVVEGRAGGLSGPPINASWRRCGCSPMSFWSERARSGPRATRPTDRPPEMRAMREAKGQTPAAAFAVPSAIARARPGSVAVRGGRAGEPDHASSFPSTDRPRTSSRLRTRGRRRHRRRGHRRPRPGADRSGPSGVPRSCCARAGPSSTDCSWPKD